MRLRCFEIKDDGFLKPISLHSVSEEWTKDPVRRWLDVEGSEGLEKLLSPLELHPLILECCLEPGRGTRTAPYDKALFLEIPANSVLEEKEPLYFSIVCLPTTLVTIHRVTIPAVEQFCEDLRESVRLRAPSTSALVYEILDRIHADEVQLSIQLRTRVRGLADTLDERPGQVEFSQIQDLKRQVSRFSSATEDQIHSVSSLMSVESTAFRISDLREYFRDLVASFEKLHNGVLRLESRVSDLHQQYLLQTHDVTNRRLKVLTILTAVYLPATLIAGIYGMNFEYIPAVEFRHGYFVVLAMMIATVVAQLIFFYSRGWFR